jgi:Ca2+-binding RTX toxin-like protein
MAIYLRSLRFETTDQSIWGPGEATNLRIDTGESLLITINEREDIGIDLGIAEFYGYAFIDFTFGLEAYAELGNTGSFDVSYNIILNVGAPAGVYTRSSIPAKQVMKFDFSDYAYGAAEISSEGFKLGASAGLNLIIKLDAGLEDMGYDTIFTSFKPISDFHVFDDIDEEIPLITIKPKIEFEKELFPGISIKGQLPTGADTEGTAVESSLVSASGESDDRFIELEADLDELLVMVMEKVPFVGAAFKVLGETVFAEHDFDLHTYLPFIPKNAIKLSATVLDISAYVGAVITEDVSVDIGRANGAPDVRVTLRSDNGTPDFFGDDVLGFGLIGQKNTIDLPNPTVGGSGIATVTAYYDLQNARFSHAVGIGLNAGFTITALKASLGGSWIPDFLSFDIGPLYEETFPEDGYSLKLGDFYDDQFTLINGGFKQALAGTDPATWAYKAGAFNQVTDSFEVFYTDRAPGGDTWNPEAPNARQQVADYRASIAKNIDATVTALDFLWTKPGQTQTIIEDLWAGDHYFGQIVPGIGYQFLVPGAKNVTELWGAENSVMVSMPSDGNGQFVDNNYLVVNRIETPGLADQGLKINIGLNFNASPTTVFSSALGFNASAERKTQFLHRLNTPLETHFPVYEFGSVISDGATGYLFNQYLKDDFGYQVTDVKRLLSNQGAEIIGQEKGDLLVNFDRGPHFYDGGGEGIPAYGEYDLFVANFLATDPNTPITWDLFTARTTPTDPLALDVFNPRHSKPVNLGNGVTVVNLEAMWIVTGNASDEISTYSFPDHVETSAGDDYVKNAPDKADDYINAGADDDVIFNFVGNQFDQQDNDNRDLIEGGTGTDLVQHYAWYTQQPMRVDLFYNSAFVFGNNGLGSDATLHDLARLVRAHGDHVYANSLSSTLQTDRNGDSSGVAFINQTTRQGYTLYSDDIEGISVLGTVYANDLVLYAGGAKYLGNIGEFSRGDTLAGDFWAYEKSLGISGGLHLDIQVDERETQAYFGDAFFAEFDRLALFATDEDDAIRGAALADLISGEGGSDRLYGGADTVRDVLLGGAGDDFFIWENDGPDVIRGDEGYHTPATGNTDVDTLYIAADGNALHGLHYDFHQWLSVDAALALEFGSDTSGRSGKPYYSASDSASDLLSVNAMIRNSFANGQHVTAVSFDDVSGNATFMTYADIERVNITGSTAYSDLLVYQDGASYDGGEAADGSDVDVFVADFRDQQTGIDFNIAEINRPNGSMLANGVWVRGIERAVILAGEGADSLRGGDADDRFDGGAGSDRLWGGGGNDLIYAGPGDDVVYWFADGVDTVYGEQGTDSLIVMGAPAGLGVNLTVNGPGGPASSGSISATSSAASIIALLDLLDPPAEVISSRIVSGTQTLNFAGFESVNVFGQDAFNDFLLYQGGASYNGGEGPGDADIFAGNFSAFSQSLTLRVDQALEDTTAFSFDPGYYNLSTVTDGPPGGSGKAAQIVEVPRPDFGAVGATFLTLDNYELISPVSQVVSVKVWSPKAGTYMILKLADAADPSHYVAMDATSTVAGGWQTLSFDFADAAGLNDAYNYNQASLLFYDTPETGRTYYFDEVSYTASATGSAQPATAPVKVTFESDDYYDIGNGTYIGEFERLLVRLGAGDDVVSGGRLSDYIDGGAGDDNLYTGEGGGYDTVLGGLGNDIISYSMVPGSYATLRGGGGEGYEVLNVEGVTGELLIYVALDTAGENIFDTSVYAAMSANRAELTELFTRKLPGAAGFLYSDIYADFETLFFNEVNITAGPGNDALVPGPAGGNLSGGAGSDLLVSRQGDDILLGGSGLDTYAFNISMGDDLIAGETNGGAVLSFIGHALSDLFFSAEGSDLRIDAIGGSVTVANYFAGGGNGLDFIFDTADYRGTRDLVGLGAVAGVATTGLSFIGDTANNVFNTAQSISNGNDSYQGMGGSDYFGGSPGADVFDGGIGNDLISYANSTTGVTVDLQSGRGYVGDAAGDVYINIENVVGAAGASTLLGDRFNNTLMGRDEADTISGRGGADFLIGGAGDDSVSGDGGDDMVFGDTGKDTLDGGDGDDVLSGGDDADLLLGGAGDDVLNGNAGNDSLRGEGGDDSMVYDDAETPDDPEDGLDVFDGGDDFDTIDFTQFAAAVVVDLRGAVGSAQTRDGETLESDVGALRTVVLFTHVEAITGSRLNDVLVGDAGANRLDGDGGDDQLIGGQGADTLTGGVGADTANYRTEGGPNLSIVVNLAYNGAGGTVIDTWGATDSVSGIENFIGTAYADTFRLDALDNLVVAGDGADTIDASAGADSVDAGAGDDNVGGGSGSDVIAGGLGSDMLDGGEGDDVIAGGGDADRIDGGGGDDTLSGGAGDDDLDGGTGIDTVEYRTAVSGVVVDLLAYATGPDGRDELWNIEAVHGSDFDDVLYGSDGNADRDGGDWLYGWSGGDLIYGRSGNDLLDGGPGDDVLNGGDGNDVVNYATAPSAVVVDLRLSVARGGAGIDAVINIENVIGSAFDDTLTSNDQHNVLDGGDGADTAVFLGLRSNYEITPNTAGTGFIVNSIGPGNPDGRDELLNMEFARFADRTILLATLADIVAPIIEKVGTSNTAPTVEAYGDIEVVFSEPVQAGTGVIEIKDPGGATLDSFDMSSAANLLFSGNLLTITPNFFLVPGSGYTIAFEEGNVVDMSGNSFTGTLPYTFDVVVDNEAAGTLTVSGLAQEGGELVASLGAVLDADGSTTTRYQWQEDIGGTWTALAGAASATLRIPSDQSFVGKSVRVLATTVDDLAGETEFAGTAQTIANVNDEPVSAADSYTVRANGVLSASQPVAFYQFDNAGNLGLDSSGRGNNLVVVGTGVGYSAAGQSGGGVSLGGAGHLSTLTGLVPTGVPLGGSAYSVSAWFEQTGAPGYNGIVGWGNYFGGNQVNALRLGPDGGGDGGVVHYWWSNDLSASAPQVFDHQFHNVAVTYDGTTRSVYLDGVLVSSDLPGTPDVGNANFAIGKTFGSEYFTGMLDNVAVFSTALTVAELVAFATVPQLGVLANDSDVDSPVLTAVLVEGPAHGNLVLDADGSFAYIPTPGYVGADRFTYRAQDGSPNSAIATVNLSVVNSAPTATNLSAAESYIEDTALNLIDIVVSDADSSSVTATLTLSNSAAGALSTGTSGAVISTYNAGTGEWSASGSPANVNTLLAAVDFTPSSHFNGNFTVVTRVSDGVAPAATGSKTFTGTAVNDAATGGVTISGTPTQGQTLSASNTLADVDGLGTIAYQWLADGIAIVGATGSTLLLGQAQVGMAITVRASTVDAGGTVESTLSSPSATVAGLDATPPTMAIGTSDASLGFGETASITFTLSEASTNFVFGDVTVSGGTLSSFSGSGTSYSATFTPAAGSTTNGVVSVGSGRFTDAASNANADGADANNTVTMTVDTRAPTASEFSPVDEATGVAVGANIVVTFSEAIQRGTGSIVLKTSGGAVIATYNAADSANLVISGNTLTIDPSTDLATGIGYQLEFAAGNLQDLAGNPYAGTASYNFTTIGVIGGLIGGNGDDQLQGAAGNDTFNTGLGNDRVNAGDGMDTVILPMFPNVYSLSENLAGHVTGSYGTNVIYSLELNNVEFAQFGTSFQTTIALSTLVSGQAQVQLGRLTDLYLAFFGRAPDTSGLEYWQEQLLEKGRDFATISKDFAWSAEAQALYPIGGGNRSFVQTVYLNSFGRLPDPGGWDYWTGRLDGLGVTDLSDRGAFVGEVILGAYAPSSGAEDRALLTNRHEAAMYYVNRLWTTPAEGFDTAINTLLARVTGNPLTEDKAEAVIDHAFANPVNLTGIMTNAALLDSIWAG